MTNLTQFDSIPDDIRSEINVDENGVGSFSLRGVARMCGVNEATLRQNIDSTAGFQGSKLLQSLSAKGIELRGSDECIASRIPDLAAAAIIEYYAFDAAAQFKNAHIARTSFRFFAAWGIRDFVQRATGWKKPEPPSQVPQKPALSPAEETRILLDSAERFQSIFGTFSPRESQIIKDSILNAFSPNEKSLTPVENWLTVTEIMEEEFAVKLGKTGSKSDSNAGKEVQKYKDIVGTEKHPKFVNGHKCNVFVYPMHLPQVRETIVNVLRSWYED